MKHLYLFLTFILLSFLTQSQVNLDSLWGVWNDQNAPDTCRAQSLQEYIKHGYLYSQPDSAYYFAQLIYDFASEKNLKKEMVKALSIQAVSYYIRSNFSGAMGYYQQCLAIYEDISDIKGMAKTLNNIGVIFANLGNFPEALKYYQRSLDIKEEISDKNGMAGAMNNMGIIFMNQGDYPRALDLFRRSLKIKEEFSDKSGIAQTLNNIGLIYMRQGDDNDALDCFNRSLDICEEITDKKGSAGILSNIGLIYTNQNNNNRALEYYLRSLSIYEEISDRKGIASTFNNIGAIYLDQGDYLIAREYFQRCLEIYEEISDKWGMVSILTNIGRMHNRQGDYSQAILWCNRSLKTAEEINILEEQKSACQCLFTAYKAIGNDNKALEYHEQISILNDSLQAEETSKKLQQMEFERQILADSLIREEEKLRIQIAHDTEVRRKNRVRNIFIFSAILLLAGAFTLYKRIVYMKRAKKAIEYEKERSDKLLLNILPEEIAEELKEKGRAEAKNFEKVTILFTDFKEFTQIAEKLNAEELVGEINSCFKTFDAICEKYGIEKIKTIGDAYMAAGGLPVTTNDSVKNTVLAGLEMAACMVSKKKERDKEGKTGFEMRVGIHTGPVIAGIVGDTKFQYDVWGDTVNTASQMENAGEAGEVNISQSTYGEIKDDPGFNFQSRGKINTKGKGDVAMWFVKKTVSLLLFLFVNVVCQAQGNLDSLWKVWNNENASDTGRTMAMLKIATDGYIFTQPDSAFYYGSLAYDFAEMKGLKKDMAVAQRLLGATYFIRSDYDEAMKYYQQSLKLFEEISYQKGIAGVLNNMGLIYSRKAEYSKAMEHYQRCVKIYEEISDKKTMAILLNNMGHIYLNQGDYPGAMNYYQRCLKTMEEISDKNGMATVLHNIGLIYSRKGNYPRALDYYKHCLKIKEEIDDKNGIAVVLNNIGSIYQNQGDYDNAMDYYQRSLLISKEISDQSNITVALNNIGAIHMLRGEYVKAMKFLLQSFQINEEMDDRMGMASVLNNIGDLFANNKEYPEALNYYQQSLEIRTALSDKSGMAKTMINIGRTNNNQGDKTEAISWCLKGLQISEEINILEEQKDACQCLYDAYKALGNDNKALSYHERITMLDDSLQAEETSKQLQQMEFERQWLADSLIQEKDKLSVQLAHEKEVRRKTRVRNIFIVSVALLLIGAFALYRRIVYMRKAKKTIEYEKDRSDKLLLNILPEEIAEELKEKGRAEAKRFEQVSILFTDFKEFTQIAEKLNAEELVGEINSCFKKFDAICAKFGIEKIKTIGDAYMAAGGLPVPNKDSVRNTVLAGLEMAACMISRKMERDKEGKIFFEMRVGIHTGAVIAGIVGDTKFQYDLWGDTVNTASRMENTGKTGKVNISQSTYEIIKDDPVFRFQSRGKIKAKGKGDVNMWFVEKVT